MVLQNTRSSWGDITPSKCLMWMPLLPEPCISKPFLFTTSLVENHMNKKLFWSSSINVFRGGSDGGVMHSQKRLWTTSSKAGGHCFKPGLKSLRSAWWFLTYERTGSVKHMLGMKQKVYLVWQAGGGMQFLKVTSNYDKIHCSRS